MPKPSIHIYWKDLIRHEAVNSDASADVIAASLKEQVETARKLGVIDPPPSHRTVSRYTKEFRSGYNAETSLYREFHYPNCMGDKDHSVPWEASRAALDLLAHIRAGKLARPPVILVQHFWRATLATPPTATVQERLDIAVRLSLNENEDLETYLATQDWSQRETLTPLTFSAEKVVKVGTFLILRSCFAISPETLKIATADKSFKKSENDRQPELFDS